ncbi:MAG: hypothetical protein P8Y37_08930 [Anaerolineales bacterium]
MNIKPIVSKRDKRRFVLYPYSFYRDDPVWVAPLRTELKAQFQPSTNPLLEHCDHQLFLLLNGDQILGE